MRNAVIVRVDIFPGPILHGQLAIAFALIGNVLSGVIAANLRIGFIENRAAANRQKYVVLNSGAIQVDSLGDEYFNVFTHVNPSFSRKAYAE